MRGSHEEVARRGGPCVVDVLVHAPRQPGGEQDEAVVAEIDLIPGAVVPAVPVRGMGEGASPARLGLLAPELIPQPLRHGVELGVDGLESGGEEVLDPREEAIRGGDDGDGDADDLAEWSARDGALGVAEQRVAVGDGEAAVECLDLTGGGAVAQVQRVVEAAPAGTSKRPSSTRRVFTSTW